jgi:hypothetical protein
VIRTIVRWTDPTFLLGENYPPTLSL